MSDEFNTKLLQLDGLLMEYKLADMREKYPDMFHTILGVYAEKEKEIQRLKQQLEEKDEEIKQLKKEGMAVLSKLKEAVEVIDWYAECQDVGVKARQFLAKYRGEK